MNKNEAKRKVKDLEHSLNFHKEESEKEIKSLKGELEMYKDWFKTSQKENQKLSNENSELFREINELNR